MQRIRIIYSGSVQGVGFRYTARRIATSHRIGGYVRNMRDGTVELVADGREEDLQAFTDSVEEEMAGYISSKDVERSSIDVPAPDFRILL